MLRHWSNVYIKDSEQKQHTNKLCTWSECFVFWVKTLVNNTLSEAHNVYRCLNCLDKVFYVLAQDLTATPEGQNQLTLQLSSHSDVNRLPELKVLFFYSYRCCDIWTRQGRVRLHRWVWSEVSLKEQMHVWVMVMKWTLLFKKGYNWKTSSYMIHACKEFSMAKWADCTVHHLRIFLYCI